MDINIALGSPTNFDSVLTQKDREHYKCICKLLSKMKINKTEDIRKLHPDNPNIKLDYLAYFKRLGTDELMLLIREKSDSLWNKLSYDNVKGSWEEFSNTYLSH